VQQGSSIAMSASLRHRSALPGTYHTLHRMHKVLSSGPGVHTHGMLTHLLKQLIQACNAAQHHK